MGVTGSAESAKVHQGIRSPYGDSSEACSLTVWGRRPRGSAAQRLECRSKNRSALRSGWHVDDIACLLKRGTEAVHEQLQLLVGEVEVTGHRRSQPGAAGVGRSCNEVLDEPAV